MSWWLVHLRARWRGPGQQVVAHQQRRAESADNPRDEVVVEPGDAQREAEHCHVQRIVTEATCVRGGRGDRARVNNATR